MCLELLEQRVELLLRFRPAIAGGRTEDGDAGVVMIAERGGEMGGELRVRTAAAQHQKFRAFLAERQPGKDFLAFEAFGLLGLALDPGEQPTQQRRRHQRRHDRDHDDDRVHLAGEHTEAEADERDDDLHTAARIHADGDRQRFAPFHPEEQRARGTADHLADDCDAENDGEQADTVEREEVDLQPRVGEEDRREYADRGGLEFGCGRICAPAPTVRASLPR